MTPASFIVAAAFAAFGATAAHANLIVDGSFEQPRVGSGYIIFPNRAVPGWTSDHNELEIDHTPILSGFAAYDGTQSAELNGNRFDAIRQTVTGLTVGRRYVLSWAYAGRVDYGRQRMNVWFGDDRVAVDASRGGDALEPWIDQSVVVTADSTSETVRFAAVDVGGLRNGGNELDAVSLVAAPEPGGLALFAGALAGLTMLGRVFRGRA